MRPTVRRVAPRTPRRARPTGLYKKETPSLRDEGATSRYHPDSWIVLQALEAITGKPAAVWRGAAPVGTDRRVRPDALRCAAGFHRARARDALPAPFSGGWPTSPRGALLRYDADLLAKVSLRTHARLTAKVDPEGFEPSTFSMPLRRAPICAMGPCELRYRPRSGASASGPGGIRTLDLFSAIEARSQLRYRPA